MLFIYSFNSLMSSFPISCYLHTEFETLRFWNVLQQSELSKTILEIRTVLYGTAESEPNPDACAQVTREFFKDDTFRIFILYLSKLKLGVAIFVTVYDFFYFFFFLKLNLWELIWIDSPRCNACNCKLATAKS